MNLSNLSNQEFEKIFNDIINDKIAEKDVEEFLLNLNKENLPSNAFIGAVAALKKQMKIINAPQNAIDVCGTGGDGLNTLNISTAVCFVVAACGVVVAKHGNKAISSKSGSADIFSALGIKISAEISQIEKTLREKNLCFLYAPFFHEALKNVANVRKKLAQPTIFNFLGPLLNPANTRLQLIGTSRQDTMQKIASVISANKNSAYIVHGFDRMDEITISDNSYLLEVRNGEILPQEIINPEQFGLKKTALEELKGGDSEYNAKRLVALLEGEKDAYRDIVILNSAFALKLAKKVSKIEDGITMAGATIDKGLAKKVLQDLKDSSAAIS